MKSTQVVVISSSNVRGKGGAFLRHLCEDNRSSLLSKSKSGAPYVPSNQQNGRNRYERRLKSRFSKSVRAYNQLDMDSLFRNGILTVNIEVNGETDNYIVTIKFGGFLDELKKILHSQDFNLRAVTRALINAFNRDDVYIHCSCPDWQYRFAYWASINDINSGQSENRPSDITNPEDDKGPGCKHVMLVLANTTWLVKCSSVINNYVNYMEKYYPQLYADIIYPAIYGEAYIDPVQLDIETSVQDEPELQSDQDTLDIANKWASTRSRFQKGNDQGIRFAPSPDKKQLDFDSLISDTNN